MLFKSPKLIIFAGLNFFLESFIHICLNYSKLSANGVVCFLQIWTTLTFHFMGYFSIVFRANRVIKVMELTK